MPWPGRRPDKIGIGVNLVLPVETPCYFALRRPEDRDALSPVFLDGEPSLTDAIGFSGDALFQSLGLARHPGLYDLGYPYSVYSVPEEWRSSQFGPADSTSGSWESRSPRPSLQRTSSSGVRTSCIFDTMDGFRALVQRVSRTIVFDVIHAHDWVTFPAAVESKKQSGKPMLAHVHSTEYDRSPSSPDPRICAIEADGLRKADLIIAVSSFQLATMMSRYRISEGKIRVVYNEVQTPEQAAQSFPLKGGLDAGKARQGRIVPEPLVLFLGRITEQKGAMHFLNVAEKVHRSIPRARFVMVGEGDQIPAVIAKAEKLGLQNSLSLTGFLGRSGVARVLSSADVLLFPSLSDPFGISPLEAMSYGVAVVLTKQSGVAEVVRSVIKCNAGDIDAMASAVVDLLEHPDKRRSLGKKAIREVKRLGWGPAALQVGDVYQELAGQ